MTSQLLKLAALDAEDLAVLSAHVQDAVAKPAEASWSAATGRVLVPLNRYAWEAAGRGAGERRRAVLHFDRVTRVRRSGVVPGDRDAIVSILALVFEQGEAPGGVVSITCSGNVGFRLDVECIEARLTDVGAAWSAGMRPRHVVP